MDTLKAEELQERAIEFILSLPDPQQEIFTDAVDRLVTVFEEAKKAKVEFSEDDLTMIFMYAFALQLYLLNKTE